MKNLINLSGRLFLLIIFLVPMQVVFAGDLRVLFNDLDGEPLSDAVIEILNTEIPIPGSWDYSGSMDQIDKEFVNNVVAVVAGSHVSFPNSDNLHHHVYSFSNNNTFELPLYIGSSSEAILFNEVGVTVVGCNIHDWMLGYIYVSDTHLFARTDANGIALISNLPAGAYEFSVWHPRIRRRDENETHHVSLADNGITDYTVELKLGRDRRIRRAPSTGGSAY